MRSVVVEITLSKDMILNDVVNTAHIVGRRIKTAEHEDNAAYVQTPEEGVDRAIVSRAMSQGIEEVKRVCARYLNVGSITDDNRLEDASGNAKLYLSMPENWNFAMTRQLTNLMNSAVVNYCLGQIFQRTVPEEAGTYTLQASNQFSMIKSTLEMRTSPTRRPLKLY